jgi:hypothetical protein
MIPPLEITENGYSVPTTEQVNAGVWQMLKDSLGANLSTVQGTPQYQLANSITAIVTDRDNQFVQLANQFDPRYADGIYQDAIGELYFMQRKLATHSVAPVTFNGLNGVVIPQGFLLRDVAGNYWETTGQYNIGADGNVTGQAIAQNAGAIEANVNSITTIISALSGLDSVTNNDSAVVGYAEEDRADFEVRRQESVSINGKMTDDATRGAVLNVRNVVDAYVISNPTDATVTKGETDYPLIRNSIVVSVVGGTDIDVATAAFIKAGTGCSWNGNTDVTVIAQGYDHNPPTYPIKILRPDFKDIYIKVIVKDKSVISFTTETEVKNLILASVASGDNRFRIGKNVIPASYICGLPSIGLKAIVGSFDGVTWSTELPIGIDQFPSLNSFRISIEES